MKRDLVSFVDRSYCIDFTDQSLRYIVDCCRCQQVMGKLMKKYTSHCEEASSEIVFIDKQRSSLNSLLLSCKLSKTKV